MRKDGSIHEMRGFNLVGTHSGSYEYSKRGIFWNHMSMGICLEGSYDVETSVPSAQMNSLVDLVTNMMIMFPNIQYDLGRIRPHSSVASKACPGKYFSMDTLRSKVKGRLSLIDSSFKTAAFSEFGGRTQAFITHTVLQGETLGSIANEYNVSGSSIEALNGNLDSLKPGRILTIPNSLFNMSKENTGIYRDYADGFETDASFSHSEVLADELIFGSSSASTGYNYGETSEEVSASADRSNMLSKPYLSSLESMETIKYGVSSGRRENIDPVKELIDYDKFKIMVETDDHVATFMFKIDPLSTSESRSRNLSEIKTKGGSVIVDGGPNFPSKNITGIMLGYNGFSEKIDFLNFYKRYIESGNYKSIHLDFQGILSLVEIKNVSISESGEDSVYGNYNISLMILAENTGQSSEEFAQNQPSSYSFSTYEYPQHIIDSMNKFGMLDIQ